MRPAVLVFAAVLVDTTVARTIASFYLMTISLLCGGLNIYVSGSDSNIIRVPVFCPAH